MNQPFRPQRIHHSAFPAKPAPQPERWSARRALVFVILVNSALWAIGGVLLGMAIS